MNVIRCACAETAGLYKYRRENLQALAARFVQRPVWNKPALCALFPAVAPSEFDIMLPRLAYMFRNGACARACRAENPKTLCLIWHSCPITSLSDPPARASCAVGSGRGCGSGTAILARLSGVLMRPSQGPGRGCTSGGAMTHAPARMRACTRPSNTSRPPGGAPCHMHYFAWSMTCTWWLISSYAAGLHGMPIIRCISDLVTRSVVL